MDPQESDFIITDVEGGVTIQHKKAIEFISAAPVSEYVEIWHGASIKMLPNRILLRYLPDQLTKSELEVMCSEWGQLRGPVEIVENPVTGKRAGFGFISYVTVEDANSAREALMGMELHGKRIIAQVAYEHDKAARRANLHLSGLNPSWSVMEVFKAFRSMGTVLTAKILLDEGGKPRGVGFVRFLTKTQASHVLYSQDGFVPAGEVNPIKIAWARYNGPGEPASLSLSEPMSEPLSAPMSTGMSGNISGSTSRRAGFPVFIGNLGQAFTDATLKEEGGKHGVVVSATITRMGDLHGGGYGFLNMLTDHGASAVIANMNGKQFPNGGVLMVTLKK